LAEVTGNRSLLDIYFNSNDKIKLNQADLYFKLLVNQNTYSNISPLAQKTINAAGKNILLIDDEVDKGWGLILKAIFTGAKFESIPTSNNFINDAKGKLKEKNNGVSKWDLVLLDLRLDEEEDKGQNAFKSASEYSGAKLLEEIKLDNKGIQVIMFTASNKAWNMQELQTMGADGFFIKESPEFNKDSGFSLNNYAGFEKQIRSCFEENYLKFIYGEIPKTILKWDKIKLPARKVLADMHDGLLHIQTPSLVNSFLKSSFATLSNKNLDERFTLSVLQLFRILEIVCEYYIIESGSAKDSNLKYRFDDGGKLSNFWKGSQSPFPDGKSIPRIQQVLNIYYKQTSKVNQSLFDGLLAINEYRNKVAIHPSQRAKEESLEYLFEFDNQKFQKDIVKYFKSIIEFLEAI
jgi:CheY-like chemotaxis protein